MWKKDKFAWSDKGKTFYFFWNIKTVTIQPKLVGGKFKNGAGPDIMLPSKKLPSRTSVKQMKMIYWKNSDIVVAIFFAQVHILGHFIYLNPSGYFTYLFQF